MKRVTRARMRESSTRREFYDGVLYSARVEALQAAKRLAELCDPEQRGTAAQLHEAASAAARSAGWLAGWANHASRGIGRKP
jgi:hypothetical protein